MAEIENELLLKFYESARQELLSRVQLRENSMMIFLGGVGAVIAAAIQANQPFFLIIIPYLALGISFITLHHNAVIGAIIIYCAYELQVHFNKINSTVPQWDNSMARLESGKSTKRYRLWGDVGLILVPSIISVILNIQNIGDRVSYTVAILLAIASIVFSFILLNKTLTLRSNTFKKLETSVEKK